MTNEEIVKRLFGDAFDGDDLYSAWDLKILRQNVLRLMSLARADELRKVANAIEEVGDASKPRIKYTLRDIADELEREARE